MKVPRVRAFCVLLNLFACMFAAGIGAATMGITLSWNGQGTRGTSFEGVVALLAQDKRVKNEQVLLSQLKTYLTTGIRELKRRTPLDDDVGIAARAALELVALEARKP